MQASLEPLKSLKKKRLSMYFDLTKGRWAFLSTEPAGRREIRYAVIAVGVSVAVFLAAAPFAKTPLTQVPAFIPVYVSFLVIFDLITAVLLFSQFSVLRLAAVLALAGGYFFTSCITFAYALVFPGLFPWSDQLGTGPQTSSAMYMFWHSGFPLAVIVYALLKPKGEDPVIDPVMPGSQPRINTRVAILLMVGAVIALVAGFTLFATRGQALIPILLNGNRTTELGHTFLVCVWLLSVAAVWAISLRKPHTVLDLWLLVVMCVWLLDIALAALMNTGRYDLGWYVGRIYGALAASYLAMVLLVENGRHYARLVQMSFELTAANKALAQMSRHDGLTGLANRRFFDEYLAEQIAIACRYKRPLALVLWDVDHFKAYNDQYGHQGGDECLKQVAATLRSNCQRPADMAARYGGEEFAFILPDTDLTGAAKIAEGARAAVARSRIPHGSSPTAPYVSLSGGVAVLHDKFDMTAQQLLVTADQCLYQAKGQKRNQVSCVPRSADPISQSDKRVIPTTSL